MKELKDYLHLYLGARHRYKFVDSDNWSVWIELTPNRLPRLDDLSISGIQLELRPLSDMTEEEKWELIDVIDMDGLCDNRIVEESIIDTICADRHRFAPQVYFDAMPYLLSKHFDLFGLIEPGLAIDKTKTPI